MPPVARSSSSEIHTSRSRHRQQRALWRMAGWGTAAAIALIVAAVASQTRTGGERMQLAFNGMAEPDNNAAKLAEAEQRADQAQADTRRLAARLHELTDDRNRLNTRLASLEHNLTDITGSISRQAAQARQAAARQSPAPATAAAPIIEPLAMPASRIPLAPWPEPNAQAKPATPPAVHTATAAAAPPPAVSAPPTVVTPPPAAAKQTPKQAAKQMAKQAAKPPQVLVQVPMPPVRVATLSIRRPAPGKPEYGIDLGGGMSSKLLRAQWSEVKANYGPRLSGLHAVLVHDRHFGHLPYRLLIGPLPNATVAARLCAQLVAVRHYCRPTHFVGEPQAER